MIGDGGSQPKKAVNDGRRWGMVGDAAMSSVPILGSYLWGNLWNRWDGMTNVIHLYPGRGLMDCPIANIAQRFWPWSLGLLFVFLSAGRDP